MKKGFAVLLVVLFVASFLVGFFASSSEAACSVRCIKGLAYRCCVVNGVETCTYQPHIDCIRR